MEFILQIYDNLYFELLTIVILAMEVDALIHVLSKLMSTV